MRWLIFAAADVAGYLLANVGGACSASALAWTVTNTNSSNSQIESVAQNNALNSNYLLNVEVGTPGYLHNSVIANVFQKNQDIYLMSDEEVISLVLDEYCYQTASQLSDDEIAEVNSIIKKIIDQFNVNMTISEYYDGLSQVAQDDDQLYALELCSTYLEGLQGVGNEDTSYSTKAKDIVSKSDLDANLKELLLGAFSVGDASAKLWNTKDMNITVHE